jgi:hypothetical protein
MAYYRMDPFGEERADLRAGLIASVLVNLKKRKGDTPSRPQDFMLKFGIEKNEQRRPEDIYSMVRTWAQIAGAKLTEKK